MPHSSQLRLRMRACMRTCVCACVRACVHVCTCVESSSVVAAARFSDTYHDPLVWKHACCAHPCAHTHPVARVASDAARRQAPPRWPAPPSQTAPPAMRVCMHTCVRAVPRGEFYGVLPPVMPPTTERRPPTCACRCPSTRYGFVYFGVND